MTSLFNVTTTDNDRNTVSSLLWLPYVIITIVCLLGLLINFCCYHRRRRLKYLQKVEVMETRERVIERRMVLNLIKAKYETCLMEEVTAGKNGRTSSNSVMTTPPQIQVTTNEHCGEVAHL